MLWDTVAFINKLPDMSADDFNDLWMASQAQGGMDHMMNMRGMDMPGMNMGSTESGKSSGGIGGDADPVSQQPGSGQQEKH
jgi:hypothetical protein